MRMRSGLGLVVTLLLFLTVAVAGQQVPASLAPDAIYYNGKVVTVDRAFAIAEAFAVKGGRFVTVGRNAEVRALAGPATQQVDLRGRTIVPGILDNHNHQIWKSRNLHRGVSMSGVTSIPEMMDRLKQQAAKVRPGLIVVGNGDWTQGQLRERRNPTRQEMDAALPNNPAWVFQTGRNNAHLNSAALKILGIDFNTRDWGSFPILRDVSGEPTGELSGGEQVYAADLLLLPQPTDEEHIRWIEEQQQQQHALGLTGIRELVLSPGHMRTYHITRKNQQGQVEDASQKITRQEALRMATYNNAYMTFREQRIGSIEAGKLADFVVLSADIMTVPEDQIGDILPLATFAGGKKVFERQGAGTF